METRIEDVVNMNMLGQSLGNVPECTANNPNGVQRTAWENGPSIRKVRVGEIIYGSIEATPGWRLEGLAFKVIDEMVSVVVKAAPKVASTPGKFKIITMIYEVSSALSDLRGLMEKLDRESREIQNEQSRQYLIQLKGEFEDRLEMMHQQAIDSQQKNTSLGNE